MCKKNYSCKKICIDDKKFLIISFQNFFYTCLSFLTVRYTVDFMWTYSRTIHNVINYYESHQNAYASKLYTNHSPLKTNNEEAHIQPRKVSSVFQYNSE